MQNMDEIYSKYGDIVYKYVFCLTGNEDITEEIVQETFVVAIKDINKFKGDCKISTWLCQIAKYIWYKNLRKSKKINNISFSELENVIVSNEIIEEELFKKQEKIDLFKKIQKLDEETRNVIYLRILGNLSYKEIAEIMGKTTSWARVTFFRGKEKLKGGNIYE